MTNEQINLVKASFKKIESVTEEAAVLFYVRLFKLVPDLRPLFKGDKHPRAGREIDADDRLRRRWFRPR
jgi:hemoglobin-like flavoprotein